LLRDMPNFSGHYRWTGFDYLGEAGYVHGGWPFRAFMGGTLDMAGFKKDLFYFYQSQWTDEPMVHILPSWTHPKMEAGTEIPVWVYSNCDEVDLFLNGKSLGKKQPAKEWDKMQCQWFVGWSPGEVKAIGYCKGKKVAEEVVRTSGTPAKMKVSSELVNNTAIITTELTDADGELYTYGENRIYYHFDGPVEMISAENGNPVDTETNFRAKSRRAFFGKTRAFVGLKDDVSAVALITGAICGELCQLTSKVVSIDVQQTAIRGNKNNGKVVVYYTTNGSTPTSKSAIYEKPFEVEKETTVKALVKVDGMGVFVMEETFDEGVGLYWGRPKVQTDMIDTGDQAENVAFEGAVLRSDGKGFNGKGFRDFKGGPEYVQWYLEKVAQLKKILLSQLNSPRPDLPK
jgi:beta-galactosidase